MKLKDILLNEKIEIDVEIGDTILTGKFKNKKTKVASIGTDDHGMPIINGRKATTFRMMKKSDLKFSREQLKEMSNEKRAFLMLRIYGDSWKGQADGTESELVARDASDDEIDEARNQFFIFMWKTFSALTKEVPRSTIRQGGVATMEQCVANHAKLTNQLTSLVVSAKITTLPMFNLSSRPRVIGRDSLVLGMEPTIQGVDYNMKEYAKKSSWFSGVYQVYGFEHRISNSEVTSEFVVNKVPTGGGLIEFD